MSKVRHAPVGWLAGQVPDPRARAGPSRTRSGQRREDERGRVLGPHGSNVRTRREARIEQGLESARKCDLRAEGHPVRDWAAWVLSGDPE